MTPTSGADIGVLIGGPSIQPERIATLAKLGERLGYSEVWVPEDYFFTGAIAGAAVALAATDEIPVGIGIVSALARHPAVLAMELSTLARSFPARLRPGLALGLPIWIRQMGLYPRSSLRAMRETMITIRQLLAGDTVAIRGQDFTLDDIRLAYRVEPAMPLYMGARGPRMLRLAGELADGVILGWPFSPEYVTWARNEIAAGAQAVDASAHRRVPCFCLFGVNSHGRDVKARMRQILAWALAANGPCAPTDVLGISDELRRMIGRGGATAIEREMPEEWIDEFTIAGEPDECAAKIQAYFDAGADSVVLYPYDAGLGPEMLEVAAAAILPQLRS